MMRFAVFILVAACSGQQEPAKPAPLEIDSITARSVEAKPRLELEIRSRTHLRELQELDVLARCTDGERVCSTRDSAFASMPAPCTSTDHPRGDPAAPRALPRSRPGSG